MQTLLLVMAILVSLSSMAAATVISVRALRTADASGERLERFFSQYADRLQGIHVAERLSENVPPAPRKNAYEIAREIGIDLNNPHQVEIWNRVQEEISAEQGIAT